LKPKTSDSYPSEIVKEIKNKTFIRNWDEVLENNFGDSTEWTERLFNEYHIGD